jgi:alcohol dehydrogenase class IV
MIVRWGLESLPEVVREVGGHSIFVVAGSRWASLELGVAATAAWDEVPSARIAEAAEQAAGADAVIAVGGGSAIDLGKAVSAGAQLPLVSVPTTYAGAEWTPYFGIRDQSRRAHGGGGGAQLAGIVYEPKLTLDLPRETTVGTAMNALAHCAEALYARGHNAEAGQHALQGARLLATWLPHVAEQPHHIDARMRLLEGAMHGGAALGGSMLALAHAMAQTIGGRYGLPHGTLNGICLPPALRFNAVIVPDAVARFGEAIGSDDSPARVTELAALGGPTRLRDLGVPESDLADLAAAAAQRPGTAANPRPATPDEIERLLRSVW